MKCKSVACIWSSSPPVHKVTAAAVLRHPHTLYTGGSDGSIIWWKISSSSSDDDDVSSDIKPVAMLCGHAASIADLGICFPTADGKTVDINSALSTSNSFKCGALISACTDGVLCVWSRTSGHCRRRRKMPPWVGSPSMIRPLPENQRYVCIACCFTDHVHSNDNQSADSFGEGSALTDGESQHGKPSNCTVVIVDTYSLTIVQTVFHGNLLVGPLKSIALVLATGEIENPSVVIVDIYGKMQYVPVLKDSDPNGENVAGTQSNASHLEMTENLNDVKDRGLLVSFAHCGQVLALVYRTCCIFKLADGTTIGEICFLGDQLCLEGESHIIGGIFLGNNAARMRFNIQEPDNVFEEEFAVWNDRGSALLYKISYSSNTFNFEPLSAIPTSSNPPGVKLSVRFIQLNNCLIRVESICFHREEPSLWRPHISIWLLSKQIGRSGKLSLECKCLGESQYFDDWIMNCYSTRDALKHDAAGKATARNNDITSQSCAANSMLANDSNGFNQKLEFVSSSMVVSDNYCTPSAIVYGFYSGDIEIVRFDMFFEGVESHDISPHKYVDSHAHKQHLSGHTGAVLCLAAHRIMNSSRRSSFNNVLVSGSMDCTVRLWDLDSSTPIIVMHQHVAPVRQIILPPPHTDHPWNDCFLSISEDSCISLTSFETLRVERMFPGHPHYPSRVLWDSPRGYIACLCPNQSGTSDGFDVLYIWDVKTGARERVLRGSAAHSMFDHFFIGINKNVPSGCLINRNTSASSLHLPINEETRFLQSHLKNSGKGNSSSNLSSAKSAVDAGAAQLHATAAISVQHKLTIFQSNKVPVKSSCPFPGIAALCFDLTSLVSLCKKRDFSQDHNDKQEKNNSNKGAVDTPKNGAHARENVHFEECGLEMPSSYHLGLADNLNGTSADIFENYDWVLSFEGYLLQFSLSLLHLWNVDDVLDKLLVNEMKLKRPDDLKVACGLLGDRGALTLAFPNLSANLELWKSSSEYCAMRSLTMVSLAQHLISLSHSSSAANSALAAFYTRNFAEKIADIRPPSLQLLVSFWQNEVEHVKMAARSLFHCAVSRAIPLPLCNSQKANEHANFLVNSCKMDQCDYSMTKEKDVNNLRPDELPGTQDDSEKEESEILSWLESFEMEDWISCVAGTSQDAMTSHIIVAAALAVWYPSLVKPSLAKLVVHPLLKLVMTMNEKYSCTAAEILAEGMENTWKESIGSEIPRLLGDIFFQIECLSCGSMQKPATSLNVRDTLVGVLLPSLAVADTPGFLNVVESQIWSTASDSPVHVVSLMILIRVVRGSSRNLAQYLHKVVTFILQTMDPGNSVMRKTCLQSSMAALREVIRVFPMVALNDTSTRLAVGDAIVEITNASIRIYDMQSMAIVKVLDASGPPGLPTILGGASETAITTAISALSFSPDGEGLVAFSENGLMIRWWSLESVWWEKLSRNLAPVRCTKLIFVPPWEGFSPNSTRSSIMAGVTCSAGEVDSQDNKKGLSEMERLNLLIHNLDLSYRLEWVGQRKVKLIQHGHELGIFQL